MFSRFTNSLEWKLPSLFWVLKAKELQTRSAVSFPGQGQHKTLLWITDHTYWLWMQVQAQNWKITLCHILNLLLGQKPLKARLIGQLFPAECLSLDWQSPETTVISLLSNYSDNTFCTATIASLIWVCSTRRSWMWRSLRTAAASATDEEGLDPRNW